MAPPHHTEFKRRGGKVGLAASAINVWESPMPIAANGTTVVRTNSGVVAVSKDGQILWKSPKDPQFAYDAVVDPSGLLVVSDGETFGIDVATGQELWKLTGVTPPFAIGASGSLVGTVSLGQGGFAIFLARNP